MSRWRFASHDFDSSLRSAWRRPRANLALRLQRSADLLSAVVLMLLAVALALSLPAGNAVRTYATLLILLTAPGYLLLQALIVPARSAARRSVHVLLGIGVSPAVVGVLALATSMVSGGFRTTTIIATVAISCLGLALVAFARRSLQPYETATAAGLG